MTRIEREQQLRAIGFELTPVKDKKAYLPKWTTRDYSEADWKRFHGPKGCDFGIILGKRSLNTVCVDIDPRNGGLEWEKANPRLITDCGIIEESGRGDGGKHYYFWDVEGKYQKNATLALGVDYLATGKQAVLAPSIHPDTGMPYKMVKGDLANFYMEITPIPDWLKEKLDEAGANKVRAQQTEFDISGEECTESDRSLLVEQIQNLKQKNSSRHDTISGWITDAVGCNMSEHDIIGLAESWMNDNGREIQENEVSNWIDFAKEKLASGESYISNNQLLPERYLSDDPHKGFTPVLNEDVPDPNGWKDNLQMTYNPRTKTNNVKHSLFNAQMIVENHPDFKNIFAFNEMGMDVIKYGPRNLPWDNPAEKYNHNSSLTDSDYARMHSWFSGSEFQWEAKKGDIEMAILNAAKNQPVHPIKDWLYALKWDGESRLSTWLKTVIRCEDIPYNNDVGKMIILSMVARIIRPGYKWDNCVIFEGPQGNGKSTLCKELAGGAEFFLGDIPDVKDGKVTIERTKGCLVVELSEIDRYFNRFDASDLKNWLSTDTDIARLSYGRNAVTVPRSFIAIGTTNKQEYLVDTTGERRYFPIKTGNTFFDFKWLKANRDQLFAEAYALIKEKGVEKALYIPPEFFVAQMETHKQRKHEDPWTLDVIDYVDEKGPEDIIFIKDILMNKFQIHSSKHDYKNTGRVKKILLQIGCSEKRRKVNFKSVRCYVKPEDDSDKYDLSFLG